MSAWESGINGGRGAERTEMCHGGGMVAFTIDKNWEGKGFLIVVVLVGFDMLLLELEREG